MTTVGGHTSEHPHWADDDTGYVSGYQRVVTGHNPATGYAPADVRPHQLAAVDDAPTGDPGLDRTPHAAGENHALSGRYQTAQDFHNDRNHVASGAGAPAPPIDRTPFLRPASMPHAFTVRPFDKAMGRGFNGGAHGVIRRVDGQPDGRQLAGPTTGRPTTRTQPRPWQDRFRAIGA